MKLLNECLICLGIATNPICNGEVVEGSFWWYAWTNEIDL